MALWAPAAGAAPVAFEFGGTVASVTPHFESIVEIGSPVAGVLRWDPATADVDPSPTAGVYPGATLVLDFGSYHYDGTGSIRIYDDTTDGFQFLGQIAGADPIGGLPLLQVDLGFWAGPTLYDSDALPAAPPALDEPTLLEPPSVRLGVSPPGLGMHYQSATITTLPEVDGTAAVLAAAAGLAACARRRRRARG